MSNADPRFQVTSPAAAQALADENKKERKGPGAPTAPRSQKARAAQEDRAMLERHRSVRGNADPEYQEQPPVPPRGDPPTSTVIAAPALPTSDNDLVRELVIGAWKLRGGTAEDLITQAKRLIADLRKFKLL